jgi:ABC-type transport system involved in multi-copper enzyme maturation permease subunit
MAEIQRMLRLWNNPIFRREFRAYTRCRKTLALTLLLVCSLAAVLHLLWPRTGVFSEVNSNEIFTVFLNLNLALIILIIPAFVSTTITQERENQSFDLLFTSLLTPGEIMVGKLFSSLAITFLVVVASMPITAVCALSGGISVALLCKAYSILLLATLAYGLFGLCLSALCFRSFTALVLTYVGMLLLAGATWLPAVLFGDFFGLRKVWRALRAASPFEALLALNHPERYELEFTGISAPQVFRYYVIAMIGLGLLCFSIFCVNVLRPHRARRTRSRSVSAGAPQVVRRRLSFPFYLIDPLRRKRPIASWRNPVYVAELRSRIFGKPKVIARSLSGIIVASMVLLLLVAAQFGVQLDPDTVRVVAIVFQVGVVAFFAPAVCSGSITDERASGTLTLLRLTPVTVRAVVMGKLKAGLLYVMMFLLSSIPVLFTLSYLESRAAYWRLGAWLAILVLTAAAFVSLGLCASTLAPTTGAATALSYVIAALVCLGSFSVLLFGSRVSPALAAFVLAVNPIAGALQVSSDRLFESLPRLFGHPLWVNTIVFLAGLTLALVAVTALRVRMIFSQRE